MAQKVNFGEYKGGSKPTTGNISDRALSRVLGIPPKTLSDWKKREDQDYRKKIYLFLKEHRESDFEETLESVGKQDAK